MPRRRTVRDEVTIVGFYREHSIRQIAERMGMSRSVVWEVLHKYHVPMRGRSYHSAAFRYSYDHETWERILEYLYVKQHLPLTEVARRCGIDVQTVRRRMDTLKIPRRTTGQSNRGQKRGRYRPWRGYPECATERCVRRVAKEGERCCALCRRAGK